MLACLTVKGFAIIDKLDIEFKDGLNVITGETGAGKSIIINALTSLLSARTPTDVVRKDAEHAEVIGHCFQDGEEYILRRIIGSAGRSRAFVNDDPVTAKKLEELGDVLIHVYGQNESQQLLSKETYVAVVDRFLGLREESARLAERVRRLNIVRQSLEAGKKDAQGQALEMDLLTYQLDEIERENIKEGEEERIKERLKTLKEAARIGQSLENIERAFYEEEQSVHAALGQVSASLKPFSDIEWIDDLKKKIDTLSFEVEDIVETARDRQKALDFEPEELEELGERLSVIFKLKEKYAKIHGSIEEFRKWASSRLEGLRTFKTDLAEAEQEKSLLESEVEQIARKLSAARIEGAGRIEKLVTAELLVLSMKGVRFKIDITDRGAIGEDGRDEVEFLLTTNPGEPLRPLRKVASGGELSRIMLAIKKITGGDEKRTFVFDEIDAGIGGRVAEVVGRRLKDLSRKAQVICITHLPQIAVYGDHHFLVLKTQEAQTTRTAVTEVTGVERRAEIARMLGGITITDTTLEQAEEMLRNAQKGTN